MSFISSIRFVQVIRTEADLLSASTADVLSGKAFIGREKRLQYGTIPIIDQSATIYLKAGQEYKVPEKSYIRKSYIIHADDLASQTPGEGNPATPGDILSGKVAWVNGEKIVGNIPTITSASVTLRADEVYTVPVGYSKGNITVTAASLRSQTSGDATKDDIINDKVAWVNGTKVTGKMPVNVNIDKTIAASETYTIPKGYHSGKSIIRAKDLASQTPGNITASDVVYGKIGWANGKKITGSIPKITAQKHELPINGTYVIPYGLHSGTGYVTQNIPVQEGLTITPVFNQQTINVTGKYFSKDITVTGINALNYQTQSASNFIYNNSIIVPATTALASGETAPEVTGLSLTAKSYADIYQIPVNNWHDNYTSNVYKIAVQCKGGANNIMQTLQGCLMINYFTGTNSGESEFRHLIGIIYNKNNEAEYLDFVLRLDNNKQILGVYRYTSGARASELTIDSVQVSELMSLRQFGDSHDKD